MSEPWIPTVDDLRVKMCYICREEERFDVPTEAKTAWTHPCKCTLIAHETCLLHWIQSSQQNPSRADKAFKCPQCGATYEVESDNPLTLRILEFLNKRVTLVGKMVTITGLGITLATFGTCVYLLCTSYGAWAVREFLGKEMFDMILTDDPGNWPWHAFINLPLVPLSLLVSRTELFRSAISPIVPLFLAWPSSPPVAVARQAWLGRRGVSEITFPSLLSWPPAPLVVSFLFPVTVNLYRNLFSRFKHWVLETKPVRRPAPRRFVWNLNQEGGVNVELQFENGHAQPQPGAPVQGVQGAQEPPEPGADGAVENPADAAARTQNVNNASLGRFIGGALAIPKISSIMGSLLFNLSRHSYLLRRILAIKPPLNRTVVPYGIQRPEPITEVGQAAKLLINLFFGGTKMWHEADPVWWRNTLGLGIFVAVKDCVGLLHLYLAKRELETRKVKNKSFAGIDIRELDLIKPPPPNGAPVGGV